MKKLVKKNRIPKGQWGLLATAPIWGPYVIGALGTAAAGAAAYPYIKNIVGSLDLDDVDWSKVRDFVSFNPQFTTGKQLIQPQLEALDNHLYTGLGEGVPLREVVVTPETTDYAMEWNPVTGLSKMWKMAKEAWNKGQTETATPEPKKPEEDKTEEDKTEKDKTEKDKTEEDKTEKDKNVQLEKRINELESQLKKLLQTSKSSTWGKIGKGVWKWGIKRGLGTWGGVSGAERVRRGIGYGLQDDVPFWEGFGEGIYKDSSDWMMLPALKNVTGGFFKGSTKSRYENYRKEHPREEEKEEKEENKEERDTTNTKKQSISSSGGNLRIIEIGRATKDK